jgi:hypothetical protein
MPVKVRCPGCERVVNAPDRARGKAVKCPQCGKAIRVPAEAAVSAAKPVKKTASAPPSGSMVIANLDLDRLDDAQSRICPKCGSEVGPEDIECPECGVNLVTGMLSAQQQLERNRVGPNPKKYYQEFFGDSLQFWKTNKKLSFDLAKFCLLFTAVGLFCAMTSVWCAKPLARYFWVFLGAVAILIPPGIAWNLHTTIIDATLRKKKKLPKYHFDKLLGTALGLKLIFWFLDVALPLHILAVVFLVLRFPLVALGLEASAVVFASLLFPLASTHMAMPITIRGWLINKMSVPFFRTLPALAYWCLFLFLQMLVPIACIAGAVWLSGDAINDLIVASNRNSEIFQKKAIIEGLPKNSVLPEGLREFTGAKEVPMNWNPVWIPAGLCLGAAVFFGATAVFLMRANGLYAKYFLNYLDLETMAVEAKYVPKAGSLDELEGKKHLTWKPVLAGVAFAGVFGFAFGAGGASLSGKDLSFGIGTGLIIAGIGVGLVGHIWLLIEAFKDSMVWFGAILLSGTLAGTTYIFVGPWAFLIIPLIAVVYGVINWSNAKFPLVVELVGYYVFVPTGAAILAVSIGLQFLGFGGGEVDAGGG